jgi:hypothetical protein
MEVARLQAKVKKLKQQIKQLKRKGQYDIERDVPRNPETGRFETKNNVA